MFNTNIEWHNPAVELPEKSGIYLVYYGAGIQAMSYSKKHKLFNVCDWETEAEAKEYAVDCKYWAEFPEFPEGESEDE